MLGILPGRILNLGNYAGFTLRANAIANATPPPATGK